MDEAGETLAEALGGTSWADLGVMRPLERGTFFLGGLVIRRDVLTDLLVSLFDVRLRFLARGFSCFILQNICNVSIFAISLSFYTYFRESGGFHCGIQISMTYTPGSVVDLDRTFKISQLMGLLQIPDDII